MDDFTKRWALGIASVLRDTRNGEYGADDDDASKYDDLHKLLIRFFGTASDEAWDAMVDLLQQAVDNKE